MKSGIYNKPEVLDKTKHEGLKVAPINNFSYAAELKDSPISLSEFYAASASQPIVFAQSDSGENLAISILGLEENQNYFVNDKGEWKAGEYIPAYVRRYPFAFAKMNGEDFALAIDMDCDQVGGDVEGQSIFEAGEASSYAQGVMSFLKEHQNDSLRTQAFIGKLDEMNLLEDASAEVNKSGESFTVAGFKRINEKRFNELDQEQVYELHSNGYYKLIVAHLMSLRNFGKLLKG